MRTDSIDAPSIAPRTMSRRSRIFIGVFVLYVAAVGLLLQRVASDLDPRYRESAEESLVDTANLLATLLERRTFDGTIPTDELERTLAALEARPLYARIYGVDKTGVDLHVYVTNRDGTVLFDSAGHDLGADYSLWRDVRLTLEGAYGARTTLANPADPASGVMYVGAAIREKRAGARPEAGDDIVGMVAVGKPIRTFRPFIDNARNKLLLFGAISVGAFVVAVLAVVFWLVRPFGLVREFWRALRRRDSPVPLGRRLAAALHDALADTRDALTGRNYVDDYVQTLAHELKSPLAAIRGAAELLREPMPEDARARFAANIEEQVRRAQELIERLLELSAIERRGSLEQAAPVALAQIAAAARDELLGSAARREVTLAIDIDPALRVAGDPFLLQRAATNLMRNAVEFAPRGSTVDVAARARGKRVEFTVRDRGPGLPEFARERVFDKFYSLARPDTGKKGTGLGLAFVREIAALHGGSAELANHPEGGAVATLALPLLKE
jgi:two-component system sensor histidine kinase CreC